MKPVNKLQLLSRSSKSVLYVVYFLIAAVVVGFIIQYFINSGSQLANEDGTPTPSSQGGQTSIPSRIPAVANSLSGYAIEGGSSTVFANSDYIVDPNTPKSDSVVSLYKPNTNQRIIVRVIPTNPNTTAEIYARENLYLYGDEVENAHSFTKMGFNGFRYIVRSKDRSILFSLAFIKTQEEMHVLQVSSPVSDENIEQVKTQTEKDLDQIIQSYNVSLYEDRQFLEDGYFPPK